MAATQAIYAKGSTLWRRDPITLVFAKVPQIRIVSVPASTQQYADTTNHDSDGGFEENEPTIKVGNELAFVLVYHYNIALHPQLFDDYIAQTKIKWRTLFPGELIGYEYEARVSSFDMPLDFSAIAFLNGSLRITGVPTQIDLTPT